MCKKENKENKKIPSFWPLFMVTFGGLCCDRLWENERSGHPKNIRISLGKNTRRARKKKKQMFV